MKLRWLCGLTALLTAPLALHPAHAGPVFEDRSDALPAHSYTGGWTHFVGGGVAVFDCDGDALPDLFAAGGDSPALLARNTGGFTFEQAPLPALTGVTGAYPFEYGAQLYLFVLRAGQNVLLRNDGACGFSDVTQDFGISAGTHWSTAFTLWWERGDSRPTFAIGNYVDQSDPDGPFEACDENHIQRPLAHGYQQSPLTPGFCPLSILAARNAKGRMALRLSNDRHYYVKGGYEQMWDIETRRFLTPADGFPTTSLWGMGIASVDLTGDGRDEVMLTSMGDQLLQVAQADGSYTAAPFSIGTYAQRPHTGGDGRPSTGWHAEFGDMDNDGRADLFIAKGNVDQMPGMATRDPNNLLMQQPDGTFVEAADDAGIASMARARGAALADFDGDGRLDLVVNNRRAGMEIYRNVTQDTGTWARITLRQQGGNSAAVGARITVVTPDALQSVQQVVGGGHAGGQHLPRHLGLGAATQAQVTVTWPDDTQSTHTVLAGETTEIRKP